MDTLHPLFKRLPGSPSRKNYKNPQKIRQHILFGPGVFLQVFWSPTIASRCRLSISSTILRIVSVRRFVFATNLSQSSFGLYQQPKKNPTHQTPNPNLDISNSQRHTQQQTPSVSEPRAPPTVTTMNTFRLFFQYDKYSNPVGLKILPLSISPLVFGRFKKTL